MRLLFAALFFLLAFNSNAQKIVKIIDKCDVNKFIKYLDKGGDINEQLIRYDDQDNEFEIGMLTYAVHNECLDIVQYIVEHKDVVQDFDLEVTEAFVYSLSIGNDEISNFLYEQSPIPHGICDACHGNNALMVAATYGREDWYFKLKQTSDLFYINTSGSNLIHCAATGPSQNILQDVLSIEGLDINKRDENGFTPLDDASSNDENLLAFQTLIDKGADYKQAWNLLYWWCMYPNVPLTDQMIEDRQDDVWMIDTEGDNCLMLLSYFYHEFETQGSYEDRLMKVLEIMQEDLETGKGDEGFGERLYSEGITMNILESMTYVYDFDQEIPLYPNYLKLLGWYCENSEFCPVYKKEYKTACKIYGEDLVNEWYEKYELPKK